jgi:hypothetical protein
MWPQRRECHINEVKSGGPGDHATIVRKYARGIGARYLTVMDKTVLLFLMRQLCANMLVA